MSFKKDTIENVDKLDRRSNRQEDLLHRIESRQNIQSDNISKLVVAQNRLIKQVKSTNHALRKRLHVLEELNLEMSYAQNENTARFKYVLDEIAKKSGLEIKTIPANEEYIEVVDAQ